MEKNNPLFTPEQVEEISGKVLSSITKGIKEQIGDAFYDQMSSYLFEHFNNADDKIRQTLIEQITEQFVKDPTSYKFHELRKKLFNENKEEITKTLTDEMIHDRVEDVIRRYTHDRGYSYAWQWREGVARAIINNWPLFKDSKEIQQVFGNELENKQSHINRLEARLNEIGACLND